MKSEQVHINHALQLLDNAEWQLGYALNTKIICINEHNFPQNIITSKLPANAHPLSLLTTNFKIQKCQN